MPRRSIDVKVGKKWPSDPYKGLTYYGGDDVPLFAGRDSDIDAVCGSIGLGNIRILLLHGLTGCGKSSFLRAGLIPALEEEIAGYEFLRDEAGKPDFVRSTDDPTASLARRIHLFIKREYSSPLENKEAEAPSLASDAALEEAEFVRAVAADPQTLVKTVERIASKRPRTFVLVIDQAEEVITLKPDPTGDPARIQFFDFLSDISRSRFDLKVIICFRTEYHGQFYAQLRYGADVGRINDYYLNDFTEEQLLEAILRPTSREPLAGYGAPFDRYHFNYELSLPGKIAKALLAPGLSGGVLPALQIVCRRLYEGAKPKPPEGPDATKAAIFDAEVHPLVKSFTITEKAYTSLGGVAGQVISYLQSELEAALAEPFAAKLGLSAHRNEMDGWRRVLTTLVKTQINGTVTTDVIPEETLRKEAVRQGCEIEPKEMFQFLSHERRRILRPVDVARLATAEVIRCFSLGHDVLAGALQEWSDRAKHTKLERENVWATLRSTRGIMSNINGKAYAMNAITPMKWWKTPVLRLFLFLLGVVLPLQKDLKNLSFIHFARWVIVRRTQFPVLAQNQARDRLKHDYLFFFANFNGTWNQCMDTFSTVLANGIDLIWRWSEKYPGTKPSTQFKRYIASVQFVTDYYYTAYPNATASDVKAAHRVQDALVYIAGRSKGLSPEEFERAYLKFVVSVQCDLGTTSERTLGT